MDATLDFADHAASGSSSLRGSHLLRAMELSKVSPGDLDTIPARPVNPDV